MNLGELMKGESGPIQMLLGEGTSSDPMIVIPIALAAFVILIILAFRILLKDKGKSEMTEEELEKDRALFDGRMRQSAAFEGKDYVPERARAVEAAEIAEANRRYGRDSAGPDTSA